MARLHAQRTGAEERHRQHLNGKRMAAKEAANEVSRAFRAAQGKESDACSTTSTISAYTTTSLATSSTGTSNADSHSTTGSAQHEDDSSQAAKERADQARKLVIERARERAAVKAAKEAEAKESKEPPRGAGADIERSRKEAADRLVRFRQHTELALGIISMLCFHLVLVYHPPAGQGGPPDSGGRGVHRCRSSPSVGICPNQSIQGCPRTREGEEQRGRERQGVQMEHAAGFR